MIIPAASKAAKRSLVSSTHTRAKPSPRGTAAMSPTSAIAAGIMMGVPNAPAALRLPTSSFACEIGWKGSDDMLSRRATKAVPPVVVTSADSPAPHCRGE